MIEMCKGPGTEDSHEKEDARPDKGDPSALPEQLLLSILNDLKLAEEENRRLWDQVNQALRGEAAQPPNGGEDPGA